MMEFKSSDVCELLNIDQNLLTQWIERGLIKASLPANGSGTRNIFTIEDICRVWAVKKLSSFGFRLRKASEIVYDDF